MIYSFDELESTQLYLIEALENGQIEGATAVFARMQSAGVGSRGNGWMGGRGNFFASFALPQDDMPADLPLSSASIYFAWLMLECLRDLGACVWLKWPNDLYVARSKAGGVITRRSKGYFVVGIGVNLRGSDLPFGYIDIDIDAEELLHLYIGRLERPPSWKYIFSKYRLEFERNKQWSFHLGDDSVEMKNARLCDDGSLMINEKRIVGSR